MQLKRHRICDLTVYEMKAHPEPAPAKIYAELTLSPDAVADLVGAHSGGGLYLVAYTGEMAVDVQLAEAGNSHTDPESGECLEP